MNDSMGLEQRLPSHNGISRRQVITGAAGIAAGVVLGATGDRLLFHPHDVVTPQPTQEIPTIENNAAPIELELNAKGLLTDRDWTGIDNEVSRSIDSGNAMVLLRLKAGINSLDPQRGKDIRITDAAWNEAKANLSELAGSDTNSSDFAFVARFMKEASPERADDIVDIIEGQKTRTVGFLNAILASNNTEDRVFEETELSPFLDDLVAVYPEIAYKIYKNNQARIASKLAVLEAFHNNDHEAEVGLLGTANNVFPGMVNEIVVSKEDKEKVEQGAKKWVEDFRSQGMYDFVLYSAQGIKTLQDSLKKQPPVSVSPTPQAV
ncbi:hypothetical protein BH09PAT1_BH09PAT1_2580 [soil metagenome]